MAAVSYNVAATFPAGTVVGVYGTQPETDTPVGPQITSGTVASNGTLALDLTEGFEYWLAAQVSSVWRQLNVYVPLPSDTGGGIDDADLAAEAATRAAADTALANADVEIAADVAVLKEAPLNVKAVEFGAEGDGTTNDTAAIQLALTTAAAATAGRGHVYVPPGEYDIYDEITASKNVAVECAGSWATVFTCKESDAGLRFDHDVSGALGRGPKSGGFRINMAETSLLGLELTHGVNISFEDIRIDSPAAQGVAMLMLDCQNCDFDGLDMEAKGGGEGPAGTRGLVLDSGASGNNFYGFRANEFMGPHVSFRHTAEAGSGVDQPRNNWFWGNMIERTTTSTSNNNTPYLIYFRAGAHNGFVGGNVSGTTDDADPGVNYPLVRIDNAGDTGPGAPTATRMFFREVTFNGELFSGPTRRALVFETSGSYMYGSVESCTFGNIRHLMSFDNSNHQMKEQGNFVDEAVTSRYLGTSSFQRANFISTTSGTLDTNRGQTKYFYAGGSADLTTVTNEVESGYTITVEFYASRTVKNATDNIMLSGGADMAATDNDMLRLVYDGDGYWHEIGRCIK
jgi:hypothetical protein